MGLLEDIYDLDCPEDEEIEPEAPDPDKPAKIVIAGGGIVGLVLALAVKKHLRIIPEIYEKAAQFYDDVGAAMGCYPNGLRVIRDIDPELLENIQDAGYPYVYRRWERHDGTAVAAAKEAELTEGDPELASMGIRRWKLQKVLYQAVLDAGIPFHFKKATKDVIMMENDLTEIVFEDGTRRQTELLFGCDGAHSQVRQVMAGDANRLEYTGVTCLMGISDCPTEQRGLSFPSSPRDGCHAVFFPTGPNEQCFQFHWPIPAEESNHQNWGNLSDAMTQQECAALAEKLKQDGWHPKYIEPLSHVTNAVRVGFALMNPPLQEWAYGKNKRVILVGDAAHPPVPYMGQGAQMGIEDAGTITWLLKKLCINYKGKLDFNDFSKAIELYEKIRIPRTGEILECSKEFGILEEHRGNHEVQDELELMIQGDLLMHGTLPVMFQGATHNYKDTVNKEIVVYRRELEQEAMEKVHGAMIDRSEEAQRQRKLEEDEETRRAVEILQFGGQ